MQRRLISFESMARADVSAHQTYAIMAAADSVSCCMEYSCTFQHQCLVLDLAMHSNHKDVVKVPGKQHRPCSRQQAQHGKRWGCVSMPLQHGDYFLFSSLVCSRHRHGIHLKQYQQPLNTAIRNQYNRVTDGKELPIPWLDIKCPSASGLYHCYDHT